MVKFNVEDIQKAKEFLNHFNSFNIEDIELYENDTRLDIDEDTIDEWKFVGLSNVDFVMMEVYKQDKL